MSDNDLKNKIIQKIRQEKPYSWWRFWWTDFLRLGLILILLIGAAMSLAYFIWDLWEANRLVSFNIFDLWFILINGLPEILIFVVIVSVILYLLYRQTDLPLVKNRILIFMAVWVVLVILATVSVALSQKNDLLERYFTSTQESLEKLPYRPRRIERLYLQERSELEFRGKIKRITHYPDFNSEILLVNRFESRIFKVNKDLIRGVGVGDTVLVEVDAQDNQTILEIQALPPRPFDPIKPKQ